MSGCAGYRLGPANDLVAGSRSVQISPFINDTLQPRLTDYVTQQLRKELVRDGTFHLASGHEADILLTGSILRYLRTEVTLVSTNVYNIQDYRLTLTAHVVARDRATGKTILDQQVNGNTLLRVGNDLPSAERQAMPLLATDFARNVTTLLAEGKWWSNP